LPERDRHDSKVAEIARELLNKIDDQFDLGVIQERFPLKYKSPLNNIINRELRSYEKLLQVMRLSVEDLLSNLAGKYPRPLEIEALWAHIH